MRLIASTFLPLCFVACAAAAPHAMPPPEAGTPPTTSETTIGAPVTTPRATADAAPATATTSASPARGPALTDGAGSVGSSASTSVSAPRGSDEDDDDPIDVTAAGDMSRGQRAVLEIVGRCFVRALDKGEASTGALWVEVTIDDAGAVKQVTLADGFSPHMRTCVPPRVEHVTFPPPASDSLRAATRVLRFPINELSSEPIDGE